MKIDEFIYIIEIILNSFLFFLLIGRKKSKHTYNLAYFVVSINLWILSILLILLFREQPFALLLARSSYFFISWAAVFFIRFSRLYLLDRIDIFSRVYTAIGGLLSLVSMSPIIVQRLTIHGSQLYPVVTFGPFSIVFLIYISAAIFTTMISLIVNWKRFKGIKNLRISYIVIGVLVAAIFGVLTNFVFPLLAHTSSTVMWGTLAISIMTGFTTYSIIRHRLFGIRFVLGKSLYYLLIATIFSLFFYSMFFIQTLLWKSIFSAKALVSTIFTILIFTPLLEKIDETIRRFLEKILIYPDYNPSETINKLLEITSTELNLDRVASNILTITRQSLKCKKTGIVIFDKKGRNILFEQLISIDKNILNDKNKLLKLLEYLNPSKGRGTRKLLVYEEILLQAKKPKKEMLNLKVIIDFMKKEKIAVIIPFQQPEHLNGFILIGPRENQEAYTIQDIDLLENIIINTSAIISRFLSSSIIYSDVNTALNGVSSPNLLRGSRLLRLKQVEKLATKENISKVEALRKVIPEAIEYFKPKDEGNKRTASRLKYEILRMIAFEGATESQIMWDLGFDVYTRSVEEKLTTQREPRFKLKDASEYSATSDRSFKRLKKETVEMVRWKLEEGEK